MPLLSILLHCARDSLLPYSHSIHCSFLLLCFSFSSFIYFFPFLLFFVFIFPSSFPAPADLTALFLPQPFLHSRVSSFRRSLVSRCRFVLAYPLLELSSVLFPCYPYRPLRPLHLLGCSLRHEIRLPSERNQSPCTKCCATLRAMRKLESAWQHTYFSHFRPPLSRARARARVCDAPNCATPEYTRSQVHVDGVSRI